MESFSRATHHLDRHESLSCLRLDHVRRHDWYGKPHCGRGVGSHHQGTVEAETANRESRLLDRITTTTRRGEKEHWPD